MFLDSLLEHGGSSYSAGCNASKKELVGANYSFLSRGATLSYFRGWSILIISSPIVFLLHDYSGLVKFVDYNK